MNIEDLRLFTEVVVHGSISEAARKNYMPQQTLSRHIMTLEHELGQTLFERSQPIVLTPAGRIVLRHANEMLLLADEITNEISEITSASEKFVRVRRYETDSFFHLLSRLVEALQSEHSNIEIEFITQNEKDKDLVRSGAMDLGFVRVIKGMHEDLPDPIETLSNEGFDSVFLRSNTFPLVFGVPEGHPLSHMTDPTLVDIASFPIAIPSFASKGAVPEAIVEFLKRRHLPCHTELVYSKTMLEYYAAASPQSICLFNERFSVDSFALQDRHYVPVSASDDDFNVYSLAIWRSDNSSDALACVLKELDEADQALAEEMPGR